MRKGCSPSIETDTRSAATSAKWNRCAGRSPRSTRGSPGNGATKALALGTDFLSSKPIPRSRLPSASSSSSIPLQPGLPNRSGLTSTKMMFLTIRCTKRDSCPSGASHARGPSFPASTNARALVVGRRTQKRVRPARGERQWVREGGKRTLAPAAVRALRGRARRALASPGFILPARTTGHPNQGQSGKIGERFLLVLRLEIVIKLAGDFRGVRTVHRSTSTQ